MSQNYYNINQLSFIDQLTAGDSIVLYDTNNGRSARTSINVLTEYMQTTLDFGDKIPQYVSQYSTPSSTSFDIQIGLGTDGTSNYHLILTPTGAFADGAITLPAVASVVDKQLVMFNTTQAVTAFTVNGNGANVTGAPTTLAANDYFTLKYDIFTATWYRVG